MPRPRKMTAILSALAALVALGTVAPSAGAVEFENNSPIQIVDKVSGNPNSGTANPYPSAIQVAGVPGGVTDVQVTLDDLTHDVLDDVAVVVESPAGKRLLLMNRIGPNVPGPSAGVLDYDFTFDDQAPSQLSADTVPPGSSGSFRPTNHQGGGGLDSFPGPGPGTSYSNPGPAQSGTATFASTFGGGPANGTWDLYVIDTLAGDDGDIGGGWSLDVTADGDITAPDTQILTGPEGTIGVRSASFTFDTAVPEVGASFECRLDGGAWAACLSPRELSGLADGQHTFEVRALDAAQNRDLTPAQRTFNVDGPEPPPPPPPPAGDTQAPTATISKIKVKKRTATVTFAAVDNVTQLAALRFECAVDDKAAKTCVSPWKAKRLKPGKHKVTVVAIDAAGNRSAPAAKSFKVKKPKRR